MHSWITLSIKLAFLRQSNAFARHTGTFRRLNADDSRNGAKLEDLQAISSYNG